METIWSLITWAVFGLVIGLIARLIYPGRQPMSLLMTMVLGIAGAMLGGLIAWGFGFRPDRGPFEEPTWLMSIVGALIVVWISLYLASRRTPGTRTP